MRRRVQKPLCRNIYVSMYRVLNSKNRPISATPNHPLQPDIKSLSTPSYGFRAVVALKLTTARMPRILLSSFPYLLLNEYGVFINQIKQSETRKISLI